MADDDYLDIEPGMYAADGAAYALVEQQRASVIEDLRTTKAAFVTLLDGDGDGRHWGIYLRDEGDAIEFLTYVAARAVLDLASALGAGDYYEQVCGLILAAVAEIGEGGTT